MSIRARILQEVSSRERWKCWCNMGATCKAHAILWNEAYTVRRSDGTYPAEGGGDECNAADGRFSSACYLKKGFMRFSWPMVLGGPCPG